MSIAVIFVLLTMLTGGFGQFEQLDHNRILNFNDQFSVSLYVITAILYAGHSMIPKLARGPNAAFVGFVVWWLRPTEIQTKVETKIELVYQTKVDTVYQEKIIYQDRIVYKDRTIEVPKVETDTIYMPFAKGNNITILCPYYDASDSALMNTNMNFSYISFCFLYKQTDRQTERKEFSKHKIFV